MGQNCGELRCGREVAFGSGRMGLILKRKATRADAVPLVWQRKLLVRRGYTGQGRKKRPGGVPALGGRPGALKEKRN